VVLGDEWDLVGVGVDEAGDTSPLSEVLPTGADGEEDADLFGTFLGRVLDGVGEHGKLSSFSAILITLTGFREAVFRLLDWGETATCWLVAG
jgi:hypothetical protein